MAKPAVTKPSPAPPLMAPLKRSDSNASELETHFLRQPFLEQRLERSKQRTARKWLRIDVGGSTSVVHQDKLQIAEQTGVQLRDLRLLDPQLATSYPSAILARDSALVLNLEFVKAVVTPQCVLIINPDGPNAIDYVEALNRRLFGKAAAEIGDAKPTKAPETLRAPQLALEEEEQGVLAGDSSFELRALEIALDLVTWHLAQQTADLEAAAHPALDALTRKVMTATLERVRRVKTRLVRLKKRVETLLLEELPKDADGLKELLQKLLSDDDDMRDLNLSAKAVGADLRSVSRLDSSVRSGREYDRSVRGGREYEAQPGSPMRMDEEAQDAIQRADQVALDAVEQLLEANFMQVTSTENKLATLYQYVDDTEDYIDIESDGHRNQLIRIDLLATAAMISMSIITVVTGFYAMNLNNRNTTSYPAFYTVIFVSVGLCVLSYLGFLIYCWRKKLMFQ